MSEHNLNFLMSRNLTHWYIVSLKHPNFNRRAHHIINPPAPRTRKTKNNPLPSPLSSLSPNLTQRRSSLARVSLETTKNSFAEPLPIHVHTHTRDPVIERGTTTHSPNPSRTQRAQGADSGIFLPRVSIYILRALCNKSRSQPPDIYQRTLYYIYMRIIYAPISRAYSILQ